MKNLTYTILFAFIFLGCSTKKNKPLNKGYHSLVSSYNVLFNGNSSVKEGLLQTQTAFKENFWNILPVEKINISDDIITVDGIENANFLKGEEKAAKTIQKHSMPIDGRQMNPKIANAYMLLGKARYLDQRFVPAIDAFNQVYKQKTTNELWDQSVIWKAKSNIRLEQENLAIEILKKVLQKENINKQNKAYANAILAMAYFQLNELGSTIKPLKLAIELEPNRINKARYLYILGQVLESQSKTDSASIYFKKVAQFHRKIPREFYLNAKLKTLLYDSSENTDKEIQIKKMIDNYENEDFLDKIYYNYSMLLFSQGSTQKGKKYLNKAIRKNSNDNDLLYRGYNKIAKMYFEDSKYVIAGKYLDSTLKNLDVRSKQFWEIQRQKKGLNQIIKLENDITLYDSLIKISFYDSKKLDDILSQIDVNETKERQEKLKQNNKNRPDNISRTSTRKSNFYFYDDKLVELGKNSFEILWGKRTRESYWRNSSSVSLQQEISEEEEIKLVEPKEISNSLRNTELLSAIPVTNSQRDSINNLRAQSYLRLGELYLVKYKDYELAKSRLNKLVGLKVNQQILAEAKYLLFKIFKQVDEQRAQELKKEVIEDYPETKFAKILKSSNNLVLEEDVLKEKLDSLQLLFAEQKFEEVINGIENQLSFIDNKEMSFDWELLKAASVGRLEGILKYNEMLKELIVKYPNSNRKKEIQKINSEINKKWKTQKSESISGKYSLIFPLEKREFEETVLDSISSIVGGSNRVSMDVYDYDIKLIVIKDFENIEKANYLKGAIERSIDLLKLKNNFVVLSSQYKNMLIYKTLDLYKEN